MILLFLHPVIEEVLSLGVDVREVVINTVSFLGIFQIIPDVMETILNQICIKRSLQGVWNWIRRLLLPYLF